MDSSRLFSGPNAAHWPTQKPRQMLVHKPLSTIWNSQCEVSINIQHHYPFENRAVLSQVSRCWDSVSLSFSVAMLSVCVRAMDQHRQEKSLRQGFHRYKKPLGLEIVTDFRNGFVFKIKIRTSKRNFSSNAFLQFTDHQAWGSLHLCSTGFPMEQMLP